MILIGEASMLSGVGIETIRYYERAGIIARPGRAANGRRAYTPEEVGSLRFIRRCRDLGLSLAEAKGLLDLARQPKGDCAAVRDLAARQLQRAGAKIAELTRLEAALRELTANCGDGRTDCPMLARLLHD